MSSQDIRMHCRWFCILASWYSSVLESESTLADFFWSSLAPCSESNYCVATYTSSVFGTTKQDHHGWVMGKESELVSLLVKEQPLKSERTLKTITEEELGENWERRKDTLQCIHNNTRKESTIRGWRNTKYSTKRAYSRLKTHMLTLYFFYYYIVVMLMD